MAAEQNNKAETKTTQRNKKLFSTNLHAALTTTNMHGILYVIHYYVMYIDNTLQAYVVRVCLKVYNINTVRNTLK